MKKFILLFMIIVSTLTACASQGTATLASAPASSGTPSSTITPAPTFTPLPTAVPLAIREIPLESCWKITDARISDTGDVEIVFTSDDKPPTVITPSVFGSPDGGLEVGLAMWSDAAQKSAFFQLPPDALGPTISPSHRWIAFRRDITQGRSEFWVISTDGKIEKKLGVFNLDDATKARYPDGFFSLDFGWVPSKSTDTLFYQVEVFHGEIPPPILHQFILVDADSGKSISMIERTEIEILKFSPDGALVAIQTKTDFRMLSTLDGREIFTHPHLANNFFFSPDGKYIVVFTNDGILRINSQDGEEETIPLDYTIMGPPGGDGFFYPVPDFFWAEEASLFITTLNSDDRFVSTTQYADPGWTFTIWSVDLADGTAQALQTFLGNPSSSSISPDGKRIAFNKHGGNAETPTRDLDVADIASGEILEVIEGGLMKAWLPDSSRYLYVTGVPYPPPGKGDPGITEPDIKYYLGQIGAEASHIAWDASIIGYAPRWWLDDNRLAIDCSFVTFP